MVAVLLLHKFRRTTLTLLFFVPGIQNLFILSLHTLPNRFNQLINCLGNFA